MKIGICDGKLTQFDRMALFRQFSRTLFRSVSVRSSRTVTTYRLRSPLTKRQTHVTHLFRAKTIQKSIGEDRIAYDSIILLNNQKI